MSSSQPSTSYPAPFYHPALRASQDGITKIRRDLPRFPTHPLRISRVGQLDADLLDRELQGILKEPVWKALEQLPKRSNGSSNSFEAELLLLLRVSILALSLFGDRGNAASYGSRLQNLKYRDERRHRGSLQSTPLSHPPTRSQLLLYITLTTLPSYLYTKLQSLILSAGWSDFPLPRSSFDLITSARSRALKRRRRTVAAVGRDGEGPELEREGEVRVGTGMVLEERDRRGREWRRVVWELFDRGEKVWNVAILSNFLVFLYDGRYRTIVDRILSMRLVYAQKAVTRNVSFEFLNRQLVWEAFTEFLLFLMPLINLRKLRSRLLRFLRRSKFSNFILSHLPLPILKFLHLPTSSRMQLLKGKTPIRGGKGGDPDEDEETDTKGPLHFLPPHICAICYSNSTSPPTSLTLDSSVDPTDPGSSTSNLSSLTRAAQTAGTGAAEGAGGRVGGGGKENEAKVVYVTDCCGGRYCYFCIVARLVAWEEEEREDEEAAVGKGKGERDGKAGWSCLRCGKGVGGVTRWMGEV